MAAISKFEELHAWQAARHLCNSVYSCSRQSGFRVDFPLRDQIRRAAISVMSNIAEGFERGVRAEFCRFLTIAIASLGELETQLYIAADQSYITSAELQSLYALSETTRRLIGGLRRHVAARQIAASPTRRRSPATEPLSHRETEPLSHRGTEPLRYRGT